MEKRNKPIGCNTLHFYRTEGTNEVCMYCGKKRLTIEDIHSFVLNKIHNTRVDILNKEMEKAWYGKSVLFKNGKYKALDKKEIELFRSLLINKK